ncbi:MAG: zinc ribbon domain-containing protein [bacterium]|nr:zinc ribbon domain-containing protein [bacterium]
MPTYEYECTKCGYKFEKFQKMTEQPVSKCPECKGKVKRLIGLGGGVIFKGPGFYTTEYRSENYKRREREEKTGVASSTGSSSSSCSSCSASSCSTCKK